MCREAARRQETRTTPGNLADDCGIDGFEFQSFHALTGINFQGVVWNSNTAEVFGSVVKGDECFSDEGVRWGGHGFLI
jgi:hypothetical protein